MIEKIKGVSNPLTIIAIFAALAEVLGTVSLKIIDVSLQPIFIWFIILFPTILILLFFLTLNFNTKTIYAPGDFQNEDTFKSLHLIDKIKPDDKINTDKEFVVKTLKELGISEINNINLIMPEIVSSLFKYRYNIEKELLRLSKKALGYENRKGVIYSLTELSENDVITIQQVQAIRNIYSIASMAIHGEDSKITKGQLEFAHKIAPGIIEELRRI
jgi:hypothetical protein